MHNSNVLSVSNVAGSFIWRSILKARNELHSGIRLQLGNGDVQFWYDPWINNEPLCRFVPFVDVHDITMRVRDVWIDGSMNGIYTARSSYHWLVERDLHPLFDQHWCWIWRLEVLETIRFMVWLIHHGLLLTKAILASRVIPITSSCPRCVNGQETILHCLRDCPESRKIWDYLGLSVSPNFYRSNDITEWVQQNYHHNNGFFLAALWSVWRARNSKVFNQDDLSVREVAHNIYALTHTTPSQHLR
ncbi:Reverse transcriptase zinc-binding domain [Sesbania bispinosa]|nr:Reverse transcriptase zinc-binding domain [Sesbania bispinosa]